MAVNACSQDTLHHPAAQEDVVLMVQRADGWLMVHPALAPTAASSVLNGLWRSNTHPGQPCAANLPETQADSTAGQVPDEAVPPQKYNMLDPVPPTHPQLKMDRRAYRLAAAELRRRMRAGENKYAVQQELASRLGMKITDFQAALNCFNQLREKYKLKHRKGWVRSLMSDYPTMSQKDIAARMKTTKGIVRDVQRQLKKEMGRQKND